MSEYKSTISRVEEFLGSPLWEDFCYELDMWRQAVESGYPACETLKELGEVNGRLEALAYFRQLPANLLSVLQAEAEDRLLCKNLTNDSSVPEEEGL